MSMIDRELAAALKLAKTKAMNFALVTKTSGEGTLIVCKDKIQSKAIEEARKVLGGGQIVKGRCTGDGNGQLNFETAKEPSPTLAKTIKAIITRDAGLTLKVDARHAPDLVEHEGHAPKPLTAEPFGGNDAGVNPFEAQSRQWAGSQPTDTDLGRASTPHAPAQPPVRGRPLDSTPHAPAQSPRGDAGGGTVADSQPPLRPGNAGGMTQSQIDAENARVAGYKPPKFRAHAGDGEAIAVEKAFAELAKKNGKVLESGSHAFHRNAWQNWLGKQGEPPVAFTVAGRIRIDIDRLTPEQLRTFVELDKAQAAALKGVTVSPTPKAPPSPPKAPSAPPKAPSTAGKTVTPTSGPPLKPLATQYAEASKKLGVMSKVGGKFAQGLKILASNGVQGLLKLVVQLLRALETIDAVQSALKGGGFIFKDQVAQTDDLATRVKSMVKDYRDAGYHKDLDQMIDLAREIDKENPEALYGSDALSTFCASVDDDVAQHERECQKLLDKMTEIDQRVTAGAKLIERLMDDVAFLTAAAITADDARLFMAHQDFKKIGEALDWPIYQLKNHLVIVQGDLKRIKANIIGYMFLDE